MSVATTTQFAKVILALGFSLTCLAAFPFNSEVLAQSDKAVTQRPRPGPENNYYFSEPGPAGNWFFPGADFDTNQTNNANLPVVIGGLTMYMGKGDWLRHLMIESIVLRNRSGKPIKAFRLSWIIMTDEDRRLGKNRDAALLAGQTDLIDPGLTDIEGRTKPFDFEVVKAAKPLVKNGTLNGTFFITIRLSEVHFQDGTVWTE